ncbi:M15 family metallopeptidase [Amedibacillus sp. YH-ame6]
MKVKRSLFVIVLVGLFSLCYFVMNQHYDELARYPHELSEKQRTLVLKYLNTDGINMLISQKIEPDEFLPYIEIEGFDIANTLWYDRAYHTQTENITKDFIVRFINKYKNQLSYSTLGETITNYSFNSLIRFYDEGDQYQNGTILLPNPSYMYTLIGNKQTVYTYEPSNLVSVGTLPHRSIVKGAKDVLIKEEVLAPLQQLCAAAEDINGITCGNMSIVAGYLSYEDQVNLYDIAQEVYKEKGLTMYWDYPGHSEYQLGYTIQLLPNEMKPEVNGNKTDEKDTNDEVDSNEETQENVSEQEREQEIWLKDNAYKYGFILRYPKGEEETTGKYYQAYTLRYVGREMAKEIHDKSLVLNGVNFSKYG